MTISLASSYSEKMHWGQGWRNGIQYYRNKSSFVYRCWLLIAYFYAEQLSCSRFSQPLIIF